MEPQRLYAFWRYDGYPVKRCLGAEIEKFEKLDYVSVKGYSSCRILPFKICLLEEGLAIQEKLDDIEAKYESELKSLKNRYAKLHDEIITIPNDKSKR